MLKIMFVDDEPKILDGLQRLLYEYSGEWDMSFATSGREAIEQLKLKTYDVIVTDMRMPEMDGAELLSHVKQRYPDMVRIVLSGNSEKELILKSIGSTHQFMAKPCDPDELQRIITRASNMRKLLTNDVLRSVVSRISSIPSLPQLYQEVLRRLEASDGSTREIGEIIAKDMGMSSQILHIVNSAFFGLPRRISDPVQAVCLLGFQTVKAMLLYVQIFSQLNDSHSGELQFQTLWNHSIATGSLAVHIAADLKGDREFQEHSMMAGLLHDTGKIIMALDNPEQYQRMTQLTLSENIDTLQAETSVFGATHALIGAYLFGLWGLPDPIVEAVAYHHRPSDCIAEEFTPLTAVHIANALEHQDDSTSKEREVLLDMDYLTRLGLTDYISRRQYDNMVMERR